MYVPGIDCSESRSCRRSQPDGTLILIDEGPENDLLDLPICYDIQICQEESPGL